MQRQFLYASAISLLISGALFGGQAATAQKYVQGGIEHSQKLGPSKYLPGTVWSETEKDGAKSTWIRIPEWLAGTWFADTETATLRQDLVSNRASAQTPFNFKAKSRFSYGTQRDGRGGIWHYLKLPYTSATDFPEFVEYHQVLSKDFTNQSEQAVSFRSMVAAARVQRASKEIVEAFQQESVTNYEPVQDDIIKMVASTRRFDVAGKPQMQADNEARIHRVGKFTPIAKEGDVDLQKSLYDFLRSRKMEYLIPVELKASPKALK
ncbi:MAG: hypothetical protein IT343_10175 [Candidatus Melainabacteria bacterium]|nr:hypothetical protein [Candidatus Melainabacteria bacterium]